MSDNNQLYDVIGIGVGPFNLSLAALLDDVDEMHALFLEQKGEFAWHPGMLIDGTDLQVPFLADLVTLADPRSRYTFLQYLHEHNRLYQFFFYKQFEIPRKEYNDYAKWVASRLPNCQFNQKVIDVISHEESEPFYEVIAFNQQTGKKEHYRSRHVVIGTGSIPNIPEAFESWPEQDVLHTSKYLYQEAKLKRAKSITIIGSGQSAAEVFYDLLQDQKNNDYELTWFTRSSGFFQLESAKLGQEIFSPDYVDYFHKLPFEERIAALPTLSQLRKGIDPETLTRIYDLLYHRTIGSNNPAVRMQPMTELVDIEKLEEGEGYRLECRQWQEDHSFSFDTEKVILATGYKPNIPNWLDRFKDQIKWENDKHYMVSKEYEIVFKEERKNRLFTLVDLEHSHGAGATNLGLAVQRNQTIINTIAGKEVYPIRKDTVFQQFSMKQEE